MNVREVLDPGKEKVTGKSNNHIPDKKKECKESYEIYESYESCFW